MSPQTRLLRAGRAPSDRAPCFSRAETGTSWCRSSLLSASSEKQCSVSSQSGASFWERLSPLSSALQRNTNTVLLLYTRFLCVISQVRKMRLSEVKDFPSCPTMGVASWHTGWEFTFIISHSLIPPLPPMLVFIWCSLLIY